MKKENNIINDNNNTTNSSINQNENDNNYNLENDAFILKRKAENKLNPRMLYGHFIYFKIKKI